MIRVLAGWSCWAAARRRRTRDHGAVLRGDGAPPRGNPPQARLSRPRGGRHGAVLAQQRRDPDGLAPAGRPARLWPPSCRLPAAHGSRGRLPPQGHRRSRAGADGPPMYLRPTFDVPGFSRMPCDRLPPRAGLAPTSVSSLSSPSGLASRSSALERSRTADPA